MEDHFKTQTVPHPLGLVLLSISLSLSLSLSLTMGRKVICLKPFRCFHVVKEKILIHLQAKRGNNQR